MGVVIYEGEDTKKKYKSIQSHYDIYIFFAFCVVLVQAQDSKSLPPQFYSSGHQSHFLYLC
jgi:hypothetical protein